jgi:hypothetical protein
MQRERRAARVTDAEQEKTRGRDAPHGFRLQSAAAALRDGGATIYGSLMSTP